MGFTICVGRLDANGEVSLDRDLQGLPPNIYIYEPGVAGETYTNVDKWLHSHPSAFALWDSITQHDVNRSDPLTTSITRKMVQLAKALRETDFDKDTKCFTKWLKLWIPFAYSTYKTKARIAIS